MFNCCLSHFQALIASFLFLFSFLEGCANNTDRVLLEQYRFDEKGRVTAYISPIGDKTSFHYDENGNLQEVDYPEGLVRYGYDENGNRIWMKDNTGITEYYYDAFDRLIAVISEHSPRFITPYRYDHRNNIIEIGIINMEYLSRYKEYQDLMQKLNQRFQLTLKKHQERQRVLNELLQRLNNETNERQWKLFQYQVKYQYDALNRLTEIDHKGEKIRYTYNIDQHQVIRQFPNDIYTIFSFTPDGILKSIRHEKPRRELLREYQYTYDFAGRVIEIIEKQPGSTRAIQYEWNNRNSLTSVRLPDGSHIRYEYDTLGKLIKKYTPSGTIHYQYDHFNRLVKAGDIRYQWDRNSFLVSVSGGNINTRFAYDSWGNVVKIETHETSMQFRYDGDKNLISITTHKNELIHTIPIPFAGNSYTLAEIDQNGDMRRSYFCGYGLTGQLNESGDMEYFLEDAQGRFQQVVNQKSNTVTNHNVMPFALKGLDYINQNISTDIVADYFAENYFSKNFRADIGWILALAEPVSKQVGRIIFSKGQFITEQDVQNYSHAIAKVLFNKFVLSKLVARVGTPVVAASLGITVTSGTVAYVGLGIVIGIVFNQVAKGAANFGTFLGSRFFRPEPFSSRLKWIPLKDYIEYLDRQATEQAQIAAAAEIRRQGGQKGYFPVFGPTIKIKEPWNKFEDRDRKYPLKNDYLSFFGPPPPPPPPPGGEDRGNGGSPPPGGSAFHPGIEKLLADPIQRVEQQLGGIELAASAEFRGSVGKLTAVVYDPVSEYLVLVGEKDYSIPSVKAEDFAVALALTFGTPEQDAHFSLDPADPRNPKGKWLKAVYIPENILAGTYFGQALFEADWLLKQYSMGVYLDKNNHLQPRKSTVVGYKHVGEFAFKKENEDDQKALWARYWIVSDKMVLKQSGNSIVFDEAKMAVNARQQVVDPSSHTGLRDIPTGPNEIPTLYAKLITQLYDDLAKEEPAFERVKELAKAVALAKWLKKQGVPVDMEWVVEFVNHRTEYVAKAPTLNYQWDKKNQRTYQESNKIITETSIRSVHLFGGVDLTVNPEYHADDGQTARIEKIILQHLNDGIEAPVFEISVNGQTFIASIVPFAGRGGQLWKGKKPGFVREPGTIYDFSNEGKLLKMIDQDRTLTTYRYDRNGNLKQMSVHYNSGAETEYRKDDTGSSWIHTKPNGRTVEYTYNSNGYMTKIKVDGEELATYSYDLDNHKIEAHYPRFSETLICDKSGINYKHEIRIFAFGSTNEYMSSTFEYRYNSRGNLSHISGDGLQSIDIVYADDNKKITKIMTPELTMEYFYDSQGRLIEIKRSDRTTIRYLYMEGKKLTIQVEEDGHLMEYLYDENRLRRSINILGEIVDYKYENGRLNALKSNQFGEIKLDYDENGNLKQVQLPDGRSTEYQYLLQDILGNGDEQSIIKELSIIMHAVME